MLAKLHNHLTYANVVSTLCLFVVLGGTSYAAIRITGKNIKNETVTTADVKNRSLLAKDFRAGQLRAGPQGAQGPKGDRGEAGAAGQAGAPGSDAASAMLTAGVISSTGNAALWARPVGGRPNISGGAEVDVKQLSPNATIVARDLAVKLAAVPAVGSAVAFTLRDDGQDTPVACTIVSPADTCNSGAATHTVGPGSELAMKVQNGTISPGGMSVSIGWRATTP